MIEQRQVKTAISMNIFVIPVVYFFRGGGGGGGGGGGVGDGSTGREVGERRR